MSVSMLFHSLTCAEFLAAAAILISSDIIQDGTDQFPGYFPAKTRNW